ncbi:protein-disulfide reductase DsbD [Piscinibacter koreensis]|uniref:protein-disulfide reductase DsbD n=1 Tax=Piscinibacter koreensis TaxID=2742824 RepID=UPI001FEBEC38|nr:protein-disulfide reductase DsbD [Schlegelella koreensis]
MLLLFRLSPGRLRRLALGWHAVALLVLLVGSAASHAADDFLPPDRAFRFEAHATGERTVEVVFDVAPGYYMYREQFKLEAPDAALGTPVYPAGVVKFDETFQKNVETLRGTVRISVPVDAAPAEFRLVATSQGCADKGLCYPPMQSAALVSLSGFGGSGSARVVAMPDPFAAPVGSAGGGLAAALRGHGGAAPTASSDAGVAPAAAAGARDGIASTLAGGNFWLVIAVFFGAGLLLSLTPCVLPMLPIVSSIIVGQGCTVSRRRSFALAAAYSLGMALVYTALGVAAGLVGEGLAAALQNAWTLGAFAVALVALALAMFGLFEFRMPALITQRAAAASNRLPGGRLATVGAMGGVSALIVSPCIAAPLAGALLYLSQTRDVWLGGSALFSLAAGMSVPLLLIGASAGMLLPRAGAWMADVKRGFGFLLLGVALWTVQTLLPASMVLALWGTLALAAAAFLATRGGRAAGHAAVNAPYAAVPTGAVAAAHGGTATATECAGLSTPAQGAEAVAPAPRRPVFGPGPGATVRLAACALLAVVGVLEWVGAASGGTDPLRPIAALAGRGEAAEAVRFTPVRSVAELDEALRTAGRPVMLDFYADWCVSCKEMERFTFTDAQVRRRLGGALLLKADVTANTVDDKALLRRFQLFGPPGTIFFDTRGNEVGGTRVIGYQNARRFLDTLQAAGL